MQQDFAGFIEHLIKDSREVDSFRPLTGVLQEIRLRRSGQLQLLLSSPAPLDPAKLCRLEQALEKKLAVDEVLICQTNPIPDDPFRQAAYMAGLSDWLLRHLWHENAFAASMLRQAEFVANGGRIEVLLPAECCGEENEDLIRLLEQYSQCAIQTTVPFRMVPNHQIDLIASAAADAVHRTREAAALRQAGTEANQTQHASESAGSHGNGHKQTPGSNGHQGNIESRSANGAGPANNQNGNGRNGGTPHSNGFNGDRSAPKGAAGASARSGASGRDGKAFRLPPKQPGQIWGKMNPGLKRSMIADINSQSGMVLLVGDVLSLECRVINDGYRLLVKFNLTDYTHTIQCVIFAKPEQQEELETKLKGATVSINAQIQVDTRFGGELQANVLGISEAEKPRGRSDDAPVKRVELHCHTKMSARDAVCDAEEIIRLAARFGHEAVAITDHGVVQSFPDARKAALDVKAKGKPVKILYGMEGYLVDDGPTIAYNTGDADLSAGFIALDVETTGLDPSVDRLIEIAAVRFAPNRDGTGFEVADEWSTFVDPGMPIPLKITELTGITTETVTGAPGHLDALARLADFMIDLPMVAHNALFDLGFLRHEAFRTNGEADPRMKFNPPLIDTVPLARHLLPDLRNHKLNTVAEALKIDPGQHHRALDDARTCGWILSRLLEQCGSRTLTELNNLVGHLTDEQIVENKRTVNHIVLLVQSPLGLYHLYRLVSESHTRYFHRRPRIPKSLLTYFRAGLLLGGACDQGEVFQGVLAAYLANGRDFRQSLAALEDFTLLNKARYYDYLEIMPLTNNSFYLRDPDSGLQSQSDLEQLNQLVVRLGEKARRPVCATCDVHFLEPRDEIYRRILQADQDYPDADLQAELFYRTTDEMLAAFAYLGEEKAREVVIDAPRRIASQILDDQKPFPDGSFPPIIPSAADDVRSIVMNTAHALYGRNGALPQIVIDRIDQELKSIIDNGFAVMYYIAHHLVRQSNEDGYIVGSRGSVGSSLAATLCGITEVNPLAPHYVCPACHYSEFFESGSFGSGYDLPAKSCPECGAFLIREGQDIPFETFLGFNGDKQPDIDLNFSGDYQARAHRFIEEMFGSSHTFRAGTIGGYADKNAQAMVGKYFRSREKAATQAEIGRLATGLIGVKRTTGQHPGGIVVVPKEREIYDFTPVQFPADKTDARMVTTHFDFNAMHDTILKLDILGHDDPTMLKMLSDQTGVDVRDIPIPDDRVMSLFQATEALGIPDGTSPARSATLGLPELGTFMARDMIRETKPTRFYDLVQLMGLSHGTDVWKGNAQELIRNGTCTINEVIGCRDSIMTTLIHWGLPAKASFDIMERVRKGRSLTPQQESLMREKEVPEWYIESCKKIKYMFPKAHAAAYTISSLRIAWFKVYRPVAYYCAYYTVRADEFDSQLMTNGIVTVRRERERLQASFRDETDRSQKIFYILEIVEEMYLRGISFLPIDLYASDANVFLEEGSQCIRPPLSSVPGISRALAESIVAARTAGPFKSRDELANRSGIGKAALDALAATGCLADLPQSAQMDLFELLGG